MEGSLCDQSDPPILPADPIHFGRRNGTRLTSRKWSKGQLLIVVAVSVAVTIMLNLPNVWEAERVGSGAGHRSVGDLPGGDRHDRRHHRLPKKKNREAVKNELYPKGEDVSGESQ